MQACCTTPSFILQPLSAAKIIAMEQPPLSIPCYEDYSVTACGKVYRDGRQLHPAMSGDRCPRVNITANGNKTKIAVGRLVALAFLPNPSGHRYYIHKDRDFHNCNANNLQWVSDKEYSHWKANKKIAVKGEKHYDYEELLGPVKRKKEKPVIDLGGVPVNSFPGYFITEEGTVYTKHRIIANMKGNRGNYRVKLRYPTEQRLYFRAGLATLVAEHFVPNPRKFKHVIFKDRDKTNCHADNLAWVDGETFMFWSGASRYQSGEHKKKRYTREEALQRCEDPWLLRYYQSGNDTYLLELWKEIDKRFKDRNYKQWPQFRSECYIYLRERLERYSLLHDPVPTLVLYIRTLREKLKKEISPPLPVKRMRETDETLRNRNYNTPDTSGKWMWQGLE